MAAEFRFSLEICASLVIVQVYGSTFTSVPRISILHIAIFLFQTRVWSPELYSIAAALTRECVGESLREREREREREIRKMIEGSCNAFEFEYHIVQSFLTPARKWETLQRGSSKPILNPIASAEQKDLSEANFNLPEDIFFHQQVWQVSNKNMRKLWKAFQWKDAILFKT